MTVPTLHPSARSWLVDLEREARKLSPERAAELHAELASHLADALGESKQPARVEAVLAALGSPAQLVRDELDGAKPRPWWQRMRRRTWVFLVACALCVAAAMSFAIILYPGAPSPLVVGDGSQFPLGGRGASHMSSVGSLDQQTIDARPGTRQGVALILHNPAGEPQTVVGFGASFAMWHAAHRSVRVRLDHSQQLLLVESPPKVPTSPVVIPAHADRQIDLSAVTGCGRPGTVSAIHALTLRVRSDGDTRTERIELGQYFAVRYRAGDGC